MELKNTLHAVLGQLLRALQSAKLVGHFIFR